MPNQRRTKPSGKTNKNSRAADLNAGSQHTNIFWRAFPWFLVGLVLTLLATGFHYTERARGKSSPVLVDLLSEEQRRDASIFTVVDLPGRGKGLVAARDIQQGELIIREKPLFIVPHKISTSPTALIAHSLARLPASQREAFLNLSYVHFPEGLVPEEHPDEVALAIFQTNAVAAGEGVGVFPRMARMNHGCSSAFNAVYSWREEEGALVIHALKSIKKGQEILTTYMDTKRSRNERRDFLAEHYGFPCDCAVCSLPEEQSKASDKRLTTISHYYQQLATWASGTIDGVQAVEIVRNIWELEEEEGYWSERGQLAADAALIAAAHSDGQATREWAELALRWYSFELGSDSHLSTEIQHIVGNPVLHPTWDSRERLAVGSPRTGLVSAF